MLIDFIGSLATGLGLLGVVLLINRLILKGRFGRWIYPATVALGMVGYTVWAEYTWAERTVAGLPQLEMVSESGDPVIYRPWTYLWPQATRVLAIDLSNTRTHPEQPGQVMTQVVFIARWQPIRAVSVVYDCNEHTRADVLDGVTMNADGSLTGAEWHALAADDPVMVAACRAGEEGSDDRASGA
ncbi:hypothetical protein [Pararhodobacter sp. CCB-MM2]|uniref:hypothetical protein n=1 Tax=Pararhodobacter sp. CCB-MM2 TaxID=1786003 RepID=UPI000831D1BC|nr:hypothetical protein [Pararhodobacter sp. CCB-MM2]MCA2014078.1 hypothetical protein [Cereibacter sphaeroides]